MKPKSKDTSISWVETESRNKGAVTAAATNQIQAMAARKGK